MVLPRARWNSATAAVMAGVAVMGGIGAFWRLPQLALSEGGGAFVVAWLVASLVLVLPLLWLETAFGVCLQQALPESLRITRRRWEWLGWWACLLGLAVGLVAVVASAHLMAQALHRLSTPPSMVTTDGGTSVGTMLVATGLTLAAVVALAAGFPARTGRTIAIGLPLAIAVLIGLGWWVLMQPGATDGLARVLIPQWDALLRADTWLTAIAYAMMSSLAGLGVFTAVASHRPRTSDIAASAILVLIGGVVLQLLLALIGVGVLGAIAHAHGPGLSGIGAGQPPAPLQLYALLDLASGAPTSSLTGIQSVAVALSVTAILVAAATMTVCGCAAALRDKFALGRWPAALVAVAAIALPSLLFVLDETGTWLHLWWAGLGAFGIFPVVILIALTVTWSTRLEGLRDHIAAYSCYRVGSWWPGLLGAVVPGMLILAGADRMLIVHRAPVALPVTLAVGLAPSVVTLALALACHQAKARRPAL